MANTLVPLSEAGVASMAAGLLGEYHVTSLDDASPIGRFLAREFGFVRREILEAYPWHPAKDRIILSALAAKPAFGWQYQYQFPSNALRILPPSVNGTWQGEPIPHEVESRKLLCNVGPTLPVIFIRDENNLTVWSALMARAFAARLAMYGAKRVTGKVSYFEAARVSYIDVMSEAQRIDSLTRGTTESYYDTGFDGLDSISVRGVGVQR